MPTSRLVEHYRYVALLSAIAHLEANPDFFQTKTQICSKEGANEDTYQNYVNNVIPVKLQTVIPMVQVVRIRQSAFTLEELIRELRGINYIINPNYPLPSLLAVEKLLRPKM